MIFTFLMSKVKLNFQGFFRRFFFFHFWQLPVLETLFMMFLRWVDNVESLCKIGKIDYFRCFQQLLSDDLKLKTANFFVKIVKIKHFFYWTWCEKFRRRQVKDPTSLYAYWVILSQWKEEIVLTEKSWL